VKLLLPHLAAIVLPAELNSRHQLRGLSLGLGHWLELSAAYGKADDEAVGGTIFHRKPDGGLCYGAINFVAFDGHPVWTVDSWDPLSCSPSFACHCGTCHGFIRDGAWVSAGCTHEV
jgi:hypothetical protein